jgi:hypothetical protein
MKTLALVNNLAGEDGVFVWRSASAEQNVSAAAKYVSKVSRGFESPAHQNARRR